MHMHGARTRQRRWRGWGRVLLLGVVLGIIEGLLILGWGLQHWSLAWMLVVGLGLCFYLFIPAVEGFLAARQSGKAFSASGTGCLVGGMGFLVLALAVAGALLVLPLTVRTDCPQGETCSRVDTGYAVGLGTFYFKSMIIAFLMIEGLAGGIGGVLGGWIGGVLGQQRAARSSPRGDASAGDALSSGDPSERAR
jgi:hypothetical protein